MRPECVKYVRDNPEDFAGVTRDEPLDNPVTRHPAPPIPTGDPNVEPEPRWPQQHFGPEPAHATPHRQRHEPRPRHALAPPTHPQPPPHPRCLFFSFIY